jgi:3-deoxy-manno-octulosonate cytidylyltransferase (CMP-KDO synthetase)
MAVVAIIPARYDSTRFPGKPLAYIGGKPMVQHVYESAFNARGLDRVLVATDDRRIQAAVRGFGGEVVMTSKNHLSGTDRLAEAAKKIDADWIVNVQGDLPFIRSETIGRTIRPLRRNPSIGMGSARTPIYDEQEWFNPNVVKVVTDAKGYALYFSRAAIPYIRNTDVPPRRGRSRGKEGRKIWGYRHIGVYAYRREFLFQFSRLQPTALERTEGLEQLRALEHGHQILVADVDEPSVEVDTPEDLRKAEAYLKKNRS